MAKQLQFPKVIGVRLGDADAAKLELLCAVTKRTSGDVIRTLLQLAQPTNLPEVHFVAVNDQDGA